MGGVGLLPSGALRFEGISVSVHPERYETMKEHYRRAYRELAEHYVGRKDAAEYLERYARKEGEHYLPLTPAVRDFVEAYYERYREIGQKVALPGAEE